MPEVRLAKPGAANFTRRTLDIIEAQLRIAGAQMRLPRSPSFSYRRTDDKMIEIDKDIPMPAPNPGSKPLYPWRIMQVGDSFLHKGAIKYASAQACSYANHLGIKFACRTTPEGVRIWRIE